MPQKDAYNDQYSQPGQIQDKPAEPTPVGKIPLLDTKSIKLWWSRVEHATNKRKEEVDKTYEDAINYVKGKQFTKDTPENVVVNYIATTFWIIKNFVYANTPDYKITGKNQIGEVTKYIAEAGLNYFTKESDADDENGVAIIDALMAGDGIVLDCLSSDIVYGKIPKAETDFATPNNSNDEKSKQTNEQFEYAEYIKKATPMTFRVSPRDFIRDCESKSFKRARWCGRWIYRKPVKDVVENEMFRKEFRDKLAKNFTQDNATLDIVELQEKRYDNGEMQVWRLVLCANDQTDYLYYDKEPVQVEGFNYSVFTPKKLGDEIFGLSEFLAYKPIQNLINQIHSKIWEQISKSGTQLVINEDALTKKGKNAILRGEGVIGVKTGVADARTAFGVADTARVNTDIWRYEPVSRDIFRVVSGINEAMRAGVAQTATDTLGEMQMQQGGSNVILSGFAKELRRFLVSQGRKRLHIIRQLPQDTLIPVLGYKGKIPKDVMEGSFIKFSSQYIAGDYDLDIDVSTMKQVDEMKEAQQIQEIIGQLAQVAPLLAQEGKQIKVSKLVEDWIRLKHKHNVDEYIQDMNLRTQDQENLAFIEMGQTGEIFPIPIQDGENNEEHLASLQQFMAGPLKSLIPSQVWAQVVERHFMETAQAIEKKQALMAQATKAK